jgi:hypothetical protein
MDVRCVECHRLRRFFAPEIRQQQVAHELRHLSLDLDTHGRIESAFFRCVVDRIDQVFHTFLVQSELSAARHAEYMNALHSTRWIDEIYVRSYRLLDGDEITIAPGYRNESR